MSPGDNLIQNKQKLKAIEIFVQDVMKYKRNLGRLREPRYSM